MLDTETDPAAPHQDLRFLSYRLVRVSWDGPVPRLACVDEGLVYGDLLPSREPGALETLREYMATHAPDVDPTVLDATYRLSLRSRTEFVRDVLYPATAQRGGVQAWVVAFGAAWDLSRLMAPHLAVPKGAWAARPGYETDAATGRRRARARPGRFVGGFSLPVWEYERPAGVWREDRHFRPRLGIKHLGSRKNLIGWIRAPLEEREGETPPGRPAEGDDVFGGHVLDALTLSAALTGESQTLESACKAFGFAYAEELARFGVPFSKAEVDHTQVTEDYIGYNRADTSATARLAGALLAECAALGIETQPTRIFSTASIAKDTLDRLGVTPMAARQPDFDPDVMGYAMVALYGGRTECHIRRTLVPITDLDYTSLYPTCSILLGLQDFLTCARVEVVEDDPGAVETWLAGLELDDVLRPETWGRLRAIALVDPADDMLPARADWHGNGTTGVGVNRIARAAEPLWWAMPDLVASRLLVGHASRVRRVLRFEPAGEAPGLRTMRLGSTIEIDLRTGNLYRALIEERARVQANETLPDAERRRVDLWMKLVANSLYGVTAEVNPVPTAGQTRTVDVHGVRGAYQFETKHPEEPGPFFFAPQAALTTAGGRLMLALLERLVTDAGGTWCFADTDSCAVVSAADGGMVPCPTADGGDEVRVLTYTEVNAIRERVNALNPYDRAAVGQLLKIEKVNYEGNDRRRPRRDLWAYAVAAKKYALVVPTERGHEVVGAHVDTGDQPDDADDREVVERKEHGLGYLRNPIDPKHDPDDRSWVTQAWERVLAAEAGPPLPEPEWFRRPKMSRNATVSTPGMLRRFARWNAGRIAADAIKPFNFLNRVFVDEAELPEALRGLTLAAPYNDDPATWLDDAYFDLETGRGGTYSIRTAPTDPEVGDAGDNRILVETYGDVVRDLPLHRESKSLGPDGEVCGRGTRGELSRRTVELGLAAHISKESTQLSAGGLEGVYRRTQSLEPVHDDWPEVLAALRTVGTAEVVRGLGVNESTVKRWKSGRTRPHPRQLASIAALLRS